MNNSKEFLGTEPIGKLLFKLAVPSVIAQIVNMLYNIVDRIYIGHIPGSGSLALTGVGVCLPIIMVVSAFAALVGSGGAPRASIFMGKDDMDSAEKILGGCFTVQIIISAILTAILLLFGRSMLLVFGASENTIDYAVDYMSIYAVGTIFVQMTLGMNMFITAQGFSKISMLTVTIGAVCNIILDPIFIFGMHMGVRGAALATVFSQIISVVVIFSMLKKVLHVEKGEKPLWRPHFCKEHMQQMLHMGFPLALQSMLFPIANTIVQAGVNTMGTDQIAAWGICDKLNMLIWLLSDSMGPALTTFTAQNLGAKNKERIRKGVFVGTAMSAGAVIMVSIILFVGAAFMTPWFVSAQDAATLAPLVGAYARMMAPFFLFYAIAEALSGACCGTGDTIRPMITTLISICLLRVIGVLFILPVYETMECIVVIYIASWIAAGIAFLGLWKWNSSRL